MKQKFKHPGSKRKPESTGDERAGESAEQAGSPSRPAPLIMVGGGPDREGNGSDADGQRVHSTDRIPAQGMSEPVPASGGDDEQEGEAKGGDGGGLTQRYSRPHSDIEVATGSGPGREGDGADGETAEQVHQSPSAPSIPSGGTPDSST